MLMFPVRQKLKHKNRSTQRLRRSLDLAKHVIRPGRKRKAVAPPPDSEIPPPPSRSPSPPLIDPAGVVESRRPYTDEEQAFFIASIQWQLKQNPAVAQSELVRVLADRVRLYFSICYFTCSIYCK